MREVPGHMSDRNLVLRCPQCNHGGGVLVESDASAELIAQRKSSLAAMLIEHVREHHGWTMREAQAMALFEDR